MRHRVALTGDSYCIVANFPIGEVDASEIYTLIELAGRLADSLQKQL